MRQYVFASSLAALAAGLLFSSPRLDARWEPGARVQLAPLCNVLTLTLTEDHRGLGAAGSDDRCGVGTPTPVVGHAVRNADGTLGMVIYVHDGREVQAVSLQLDATGRVGTWQDTAGRAGMAVPPGAVALRRPTRGPLPAPASRNAPGTTAGVGRPPAFWPADPSNGVGSSFFPQFACKYGREFLGLQNSEIMCSDVVTPAPSSVADLALGSDGNPIFVGPGSGAGVTVTQCGNPACSADSTSVVVNATASGGRIAIGFDGLPVVAMLSAGAMTVTKCGDLGCTTGLESIVSNPGPAFALVVGSDGFPLIVGSSAGLVRVIHCGDAACTSGYTTTDVPLQDATAVEPKVAIAPNGLPVIAFRYDVPRPDPESEDGVKLHFCADLMCSSGSTSGPVMLNTVSRNYKFCCGLSLAIGSDGLAIVASHRMFWGLWAAHCDDATCTSSASGTKNDDWTLPGLNVALMIGARGVPVMSHHGGNQARLKVTECRDVACTGFAHPTRTLDVGFSNGAAVVGSEGLPIVTGAGSIVACGTQGCQMPAVSIVLVPGPRALVPPNR